MTFVHMNLSPPTYEALRTLRFSSPTEVQERTIPLICAGNDIVVRSQTGTGKTAAFGIGIVERIAKNPSERALVLTPTRELALQVAKDLSVLARPHGFFTTVVYGGEPLEKQVARLSRPPHILVATPGRLLDLVERRIVTLSSYTIIVLDEADRMVDMGFLDDVHTILSQVSPLRQLLLFSATLTNDVQRVIETFSPSATVIEIGEQRVVSSVSEIRIPVTSRSKFTTLLDVLSHHKNLRVLIFVATKKMAETLSSRLLKKGINARAIHGDMRQAKRERVLQEYRHGRFPVLVATDVASRGLHIEDVSVVINYDEAETAETHLHRVGRTGRMGAQGKAITLVNESEKTLRIIRRTPDTRPSERPTLFFVK